MQNCSFSKKTAPNPTFVNLLQTFPAGLKSEGLSGLKTTGFDKIIYTYVSFATCSEQRMSSSDIESQPTTSRGSLLLASVSHKWKIILSVAILLGVVAAVGVCATVVGLGVASTSSGGRGSEEGVSEGTRSLSDGGEEVYTGFYS